jgi:hypothetical protein
MPPELTAPIRQMALAELVLRKVAGEVDGLSGAAGSCISIRTWNRLQDARLKSQQHEALAREQIRAELEAMLGQIRTEFAHATQVVRETERARSSFEARLRSQHVDAAFAHLRRTLPQYRELYSRHRLAIAAVADPQRIKLGTISADFGSGCEALELLATDVLRDWDPNHFNGVDPDQIRIAVEREASLAFQPASAGSPGLDRPSPRKAQRVPLMPSPPPTTRNGRPSREAIDATAKTTLTAALDAATENGSNYVPDRRAIASAVSKQLGFEIGVSSLFAKKKHGDGHAHRYPEFIALWRKTKGTLQKPGEARRNGTRMHAKSHEEE